MEQPFEAYGHNEMPLKMCNWNLRKTGNREWEEEGKL